MSSQKQVTTKFQEFDPKKLTFTDFEENERTKTQLIAFPNYEGGALMLQCPWIKLFTYGVPRESEYVKTDADRAKIKIPLDLTDSEVKEFYEKLREFDSIMGSLEMKKKLFPKKFDKYEYVPLVRTPAEEEEEEEEDSKKTKYPRPPYIKVKLDTTWPEIKIKTKVYKSIMKDDKRERTEEKIETVQEFANFVRYMSNIRPIIRPVKGWAQKKQANPSQPMQYGVMFKLIKLEVEPSEGSGGNNLITEYLNQDAFIDSDEENEFQGPPKSPVKSSLPLKKVDEEDEEEEEEEEEPEPPKKNKSSTKAPSSRKTK